MNATATTVKADSTLVLGFKLAYQGTQRRLNQLPANDPKRAELEARLIKLQGLIKGAC